MIICKSDGCENLIEGMSKRAKYCCKKCKNRAYCQKPEVKARRNEYQKKYYQRPGVKEYHKRRCQSPEYRAKKKGYYQTPEYKEREKSRRQTPKYKAYHRNYYHKVSKHNPGYIAKTKERKQTPEYKSYERIYRKEYKQRPEVQKHLKEYCQRSEVKARHLESDKKYRQSQKYKKRMQTPEVKKRNRDRVQRREALKSTLPATFTPEDWKYALSYFGGCAYCVSTSDLNQEHFIPLSKGGPYTLDNIIPACKSCNSSKKDRAPGDWCTPEQYERVMRHFADLRSSKVILPQLPESMTVLSYLSKAAHAHTRARAERKVIIDN